MTETTGHGVNQRALIRMTPAEVDAFLAECRTMTMCSLCGVSNCTITVAIPDFVVSSVLVAVTVAVAGEDGAVKSPLALMVPALADHVIAEL